MRASSRSSSSRPRWWPRLSCLDEVELLPLPLAGRSDSGGATCRIGRFAVAKLRALVSGRHEAGAPVAIAARRIVAVVGQHDVAGQVVALAAQAVQAPGAQRRAAAQDAAGVHLAHAAHVVQAVGMATANDGDVVHAGGDFRIPVADPNARLSVLGEFALGAQQRRVGRAAHGRERAVEAIGQRLAGQLVELGLGIEQVDVAGPAVEEAPDDALGRGPESAIAGERW